MKKNYLLLILAIWLGGTNLTAQIPGYQGRYFVLHADLYSLMQKDFSIGGDLTVLRRMSLGVDYMYRTQEFDRRYKVAPPAIQNQEPGTIETETLTLGMRIYMNKAICAPLGWYSNFEVGKGVATISSTRSYPVYHSAGYVERNIDEDFIIENAPVFNLEWGFGCRRIFFDYLTLDAQLGLWWGRITGIDYTQIGHYEINNYFRPNLQKWYDGPFRQGDVGLSMNIRIGVLLL